MEMSELEAEIKTMSEFMPILVYESGMYFGELALLNKKPRAGTIVTLTDCFFAVIDALSYERLLKKEAAA